MPRLGSFQELISGSTTDVARICEALRDQVLEVDPGTVEVVRLGDRAATYGVGPRKMLDGYLYIMPQSRWVNLGFYQGSYLPDPNGLLEGTGKSLRHVKVRSVDEVAVPALVSLMREAVGRKRS